MVQFSRFASAELCIHSVIHTKVCGFPHSDIAVSLLYCQLLRAFRRLTRPSSPIIAKASTWCTYLLDSIIWSTCVDFVCLALTTRTNFRYLTLIQFTALLWIVPAFCVQEQLIQSSPKLLWLKYIYIYNQHCLCLLISASDLLKSDAIIFANKNRLFYLNPLLFAKALFIPEYNTWYLVEANGIEPMTPCLQSRCSTNWAMPPVFFSLGLSNGFKQFGGSGRTWTSDPTLIKRVL